MKISIIVPVYNMEKYLNRCVDSIINQKKFVLSNENVEILLVNDGSNDNSQYIIDQYVRKYDFIKGFVKQNGGLSDARNYGLAKATGDYVWFIDSDDWIDKDSLKEIFYELKTEKIEVLEFDYSMSYDYFQEKKNSDKYYSSIVTKSIITGKESIKKYGYSISVTNKIISRKKINEIDFYFPRNRFSEDTIPILKLLLVATKYKKIKKCFYYYYVREDSITNNKDINHLKKKHSDQIQNIIEMAEVVEKEEYDIVNKIKEMQYFLTFNTLFSAFFQIREMAYFREISSDFRKLGLFPIKKYGYHNSLKRRLLATFFNIIGYI